MEYIISPFDLRKYHEGVLTKNLSEIIENMILKLPGEMRKEARELKFTLKETGQLETKYSSTYIVDFVNASPKLKSAMESIYSYITVYDE